MAIELATKFAPYTDEQFKSESKKSLLTNQDFKWEGAHAIRIYKITTSDMNDYNRKMEKVLSGVAEDNPARWSLYGDVKPLSATTELLVLAKDRSFTFAIDKADQDETAQQLEAASSLARQNREVVIPEIDSYTFGVMCGKAGTKPEAVALDSTNIYSEILKGNEALDTAEAPESGRVLVVTPAIYAIMKKCKDITMETDIGNDLRIKGVIGVLDGCTVLKIPANRLPVGFGFMIAHPYATVAPVKLQDYKIHEDPPGISGSLVEGRVYYDAFVLENKAKAIYYQAISIPPSNQIEAENSNAEVPGTASFRAYNEEESVQAPTAKAARRKVPQQLEV